MAVQDKYVDSLIGNLGDAPVMTDAIKSGGVSIKTRIIEVAIVAADDDGSKYRLCKVGANEVPLLCYIATTAITAGTDYDLGLYKTGVGGGVKVADVFMNGQTFAVAKATLNPATALNGLSALTASTAGISGKRMFEHAGDTVTNKQPEYDFVLTTNTIGSVDGSITLMLVTAVNN